MTVTAPRPRYTIMPDFESLGVWFNPQGSTLLGQDVSAFGWPDDERALPPELQKAFRDWAATFHRAPWSRVNDGILDMDWTSFHEEGLELGRRLKRAIRIDADVFYSKPAEDPNLHLHEEREILSGGTVRETPQGIPWVRPYLMDFAWLPRMIVSGGQTGADRAALDWACGQRIPHGGWCPRGRIAEDGPLPLYYQLRETASSGYRQRTKRNVLDSDATLILNQGDLSGGTLATLRFARAAKRPWLVVQLDSRRPDESARNIVRWLDRHRTRTLNVAGPRESAKRGTYARALALLDACLSEEFRSLKGGNADAEK